MSNIRDRCVRIQQSAYPCARRINLEMQYGDKNYSYESFRASSQSPQYILNNIGEHVLLSLIYESGRAFS